MPARDTYEIILQLKDELSAGLKQVNAQLNQTKTVGQKTEAGITGLSKSLKSAAAPLKAFSSIMRQLVTLGGAAYAIRQVISALSDMEAAYAKAKPESQALAGSAYQFTKAVNESKVALGSLVSEILSPARAEIIAMMQEAAKAITQAEDGSRSLGETLGEVLRWGAKGIEMLFMQVVDGWQLFGQIMGLMLKLTAAVGKTLWVPIREGFLWIIQPIKEAFATMINFFLNGITSIVQWLGKAAQKISFGKFGGEMAGWSAGQVNAGQFTAGQTNVIDEWKKIWGEFGGDLKAFGDDFLKTVQTYVDVVERRPGDAQTYDLPPAKTDEETKKENEERANILEGIQNRIDLMRALNKESQAKTDKWNADYVKLLEDIKKAEEEQAKAAREARRQRATSALGAIQDPMSAITNLLQEAFSGTAGVSGKMNMGEMIQEFFLEFQFGIEKLIGTLADMAPIILLFLALMEIFKGIQEILGPIVEGILGLFVGHLQAIGNLIGTLLLPIFEALEPAINAVFTLLDGILPLFLLLGPIFDLIGLVIKAALIPVIMIIRGVIWFINGIIDAINWLIPGHKWDIANIAMPEVPKFHRGGVAEDETMALLKKGEVVLNPYKSRAYMAGGGAGGITINAPNARYIDKSIAGDLVKIGLAAMRA